MAVRVCGVLKQVFRGTLGLATLLLLLRTALALPLSLGRDFETPKDRELLPPDPITAAMEQEGQLYVLYGDTAVVDVYDGAGRFLWAVSVPYHDHNEDAMMKLEAGSLFLYQAGHSVYEYRCADGRFLGSFDQRDRAEQFPGGGYQTTSVADGQAAEGVLYFTGLQVLRGDAAGRLVPILSHSRWWLLLRFPVVWAIGFFSLLSGFLLEQLFLPRCKLREIQRAQASRLRPRDPAAGAYLRYAQITVAVNLLYGAVNLAAVLAFRTGILCPGIMLVAVWFIGSNIAMDNREALAQLWGTDVLLVQKWKGYLWASLLAALCSVAAGSLLAR